ncbi:MAG: acyl-[acyl-carrier-protein] thioesterase [Butyrivibrio sp.]|uniref:acyl-[acyl-carrier-protein] thioesterase n=1 Tax=Butyrivibrio sp. TaxID=28121 RepID=UPI0025D78A00|nr:acyl-ACP thioesterase domain-containing protein [Butyrivibrio sp.]MCR5770425.1 acyl-[acyl-carrier-protein] thioesterase [Butyrivibrio sp.]
MYSFKSRIRYSEINSQGFLSMEALMNYFQDCSTFQSEDLGIGLDYLDKQGAAWVINSWQVDVSRYPKIGENVIIGTIPYEIKGFIGCRNFFMDTEDGERLALANSIWAFINLETGRPVKVTPDIIDGYQISEKLPMDYQPRKIPFPEEGDIRSTQEILIHPFHLDTNQHVNNNQYITMAIDSIRSLKESDEKAPFVKRLRAEYKMQAHLGDVIYPICCSVLKDDRLVHTVSLNDENGKAYSVIEVTE